MDDKKDELKEKANEINGLNPFALLSEMEEPSFKDLPESIQALYVEAFEEADKSLKEKMNKIFYDEDGNLKPELKDSGMTDKEVGLIIGRSKYPKEYVKAKDKFTNDLFSGKFSGTDFIEPTDYNTFKNINIRVAVNFENLPHVGMSKRLDEDDEAVHNAILTLYSAGNEYFTTLQVYRVMTGNQRAIFKKNSKRREEIEGRIEKLMTTLIYIDPSNEAKFKDYEKLENFEFKGNLLSLKSMTERRKDGTVKDIIKILDAPPLYRYAGAKNQISRVPMKLLDTPGHKSDRHIAVRNYMQERIATMKSNPSFNKKIVLNNIYNLYKIQSDNPNTEKTNKKRAKQLAVDILDFYVEQGFIKGFEEEKKPNKRSRKESGYKIIL